MNFSFNKAEDSPGFLLWRLSNHWASLQRQALKKLNLTHGQFVVLASILWLSHQNNNLITQQHIAEHANMDKMLVSDLIVTLAEKKLLTRKPHQQDKRAKSLQLSVKGKNLTLKAIPIVEHIDRDFFSTHKAHINQLKLSADKL